MIRRAIPLILVLLSFWGCNRSKYVHNIDDGLAVLLRCKGVTENDALFRDLTTIRTEMRRLQSQKFKTGEPGLPLPIGRIRYELRYPDRPDIRLFVMPNASKSAYWLLFPASGKHYAINIGRWSRSDKNRAIILATYASKEYTKEDLIEEQIYFPFQ